MILKGNFSPFTQNPWLQQARSWVGRTLMWHARGLGLIPEHQINQTRWLVHPIVPELGMLRQEDQKFKIICGYIEKSEAYGGRFSKNKQTKPMV